MDVTTLSSKGGEDDEKVSAADDDAIIGEIKEENRELRKQLADMV